MKKFLCTLMVLPAVVASASAQKNTGDIFKVYFMGGQSNMEGFGFNKDLPPNLQKPMKDVYIYHGSAAPDGDATGGNGQWETLRPGHGFDFKSNGVTNQPGERFGSELTFAARLQELYPNEKIAVIKYARGGSSLDSLAAAEWGCWEPDMKGKDGINQYDLFLKTLAAALDTRDIDGDGRPDRLVPAGIVWMQGEADAAFTEAIAQGYQAKLKRMMELVRAALRRDDLPVIIGKISDSNKGENGKVWKFGSTVQQAQEDFVRQDGFAAIVRSTSGYGYSDIFHYKSAGYLDLGKKFAEAVQQIRAANP